MMEKLLDERFFAYRTRSTAMGGMAGACVAGGLFLYKYYGEHVFRWDLFAILVTIAGVKLAAMAWFYATR